MRKDDTARDLPDMKKLNSEMSDDARRCVELERLSAGNDARKRKAEEQAGVKLDVRTKRRSLEGSDKWLEKAKVYDTHVEKLDVAIKEIEKHQLMDELQRTKGNRSKSASVVRQQLRVEKQCMTVKAYFKRIASRDRKKAEKLSLRARRIENLLAKMKRKGVDDAVAAAAADAAVDDDDDDNEGGGGGGDDDPVDDDDASSDSYDAAAYEQKHHIAAEVGDLFGVSGRQVRRWTAEFLASFIFFLAFAGFAKTSHAH